MILASGVSLLYLPSEVGSLEFFINAIDWEVIIFLISIFTIVEILNENKFFHEISKRIIKKYKTNIRMMFYVLNIISTLMAAIIEDLSVALIFAPIIILACAEIKINPTPFLLGMTISINLASTLTSFGSAENILIANILDLDLKYFIKYLSPYFVITTSITLLILDKAILSKYIKERKINLNKNVDAIINKKIQHHKILNENELREHVFYNPKIELEEKINKITINSKDFRKNLIGLIIFIILLVSIQHLYIPGLIGLMLFVFLNPIKTRDGKKRPSLSHYFKKVDYKLIYFFICLFILIKLMDVSGTILLFENYLKSFSQNDVFFISLIILILSSLLSGFMDNAPVTILFLPIISFLISPLTEANAAPIIIAFILGINVGGNFLPQGSACDMMTLEIAREHSINDLTYKKLTKVGGALALVHILIGIIYIYVMYILVG
ncbi:MAG: SLC13 family permease [Promethearchaeota archaeon]